MEKRARGGSAPPPAASHATTAMATNVGAHRGPWSGAAGAAAGRPTRDRGRAGAPGAGAGAGNAAMARPMGERRKQRGRGGGGAPAGAHQLLVELQEALHVLVLDAGALHRLYQQPSELYRRVHGRPTRRPAAMGASCRGRASCLALF